MKKQFLALFLASSCFAGECDWDYVPKIQDEHSVQKMAVSKIDSFLARKLCNNLLIHTIPDTHDVYKHYKFSGDYDLLFYKSFFNNGIVSSHLAYVPHKGKKIKTLVEGAGNWKIRRGKLTVYNQFGVDLTNNRSFWPKEIPTLIFIDDKSAILGLKKGGEKYKIVKNSYFDKNEVKER